MPHVNVVDGKIVGFAESNAPIPHRVTRYITKSGNYGLADDARKMFRSLCVTPSEDRREAEELTSFMAAGRGRGRGRGIRPFDPVPKPEAPHRSFSGSERSFGLSSFGRGIKPSPTATSPSDSFCDYETSSATTSKPSGVRYVTQCLFEGEQVKAGRLRIDDNKPNSKPAKTNGYVMYLQYIKKVNGITESMTTDQLIKMFDKDWKALSEDERKAWKDKAKGLRPVPPPSGNANPNQFKPQTKNANRANAIARGLTAAGLVQDDDDDDDDYY